MAAWGRPRLAVACCVSVALQGVHGQIRVMSPETLVKQFDQTHGKIDGSTATFGAPFYGQRIIGSVVFDESESSHCVAEDYFPQGVPEAAEVAEAGKLIDILLVRRGNCTFVRKVSIAEGKSAHAVIIVDQESSNNTRADILRIIMADDGYGVRVNIPSILIAWEDGKHLIESAKNGKSVVVELAWDVPTQKVVTMDLWMSSASRQSNHFLQTFSEKRKALNEAVRFVPHCNVFTMDSGTDFNDLCRDSVAVYCAEDPDGAGWVTGKMVLEEDVRQLCIHKLTKVSRMHPDATIEVDSTKTEYAEKYWNYVERFLKECPIDADKSVAADRKFGAECSERLARDVGIDTQAVRQCVTDEADDLLSEQLAQHAWSSLALRINGWRYKGALEADLVTRAICSAFTEQPDACRALTEPGSPSTSLLPPNDSDRGVGFGTFFLVMVLVCVGSCLALLLYKRSLHKHIHRALHEEVMLEVQAQMDSYRQLGGK